MRMTKEIRQSTSLEQKWSMQKQLEIVKMCFEIPVSEIINLTRYLSSNLSYKDFMTYLKYIDRRQDAFLSQNSSLLEVAENAKAKILKIRTELENILSEIPESFIQIAWNNSVVKQCYAELDGLKIAASACIEKIDEFINGQYLPASELYPLLMKLGLLFENYLKQFQTLLKTIVLIVKNLNPAIVSENIYDNLQEHCELTNEIDPVILRRGHSLQHVLLQRYQRIGESSVPSLDVALHRAIQTGPLEDVNDLLAIGAPINACTFEKDQAALHLAVMTADVEKVKALRAQGADTKLKTKDGKTALDMALEMKVQKIVRVLKPTQSDVFRQNVVLTAIIRQLPIADMFILQRVAPNWKAVSGAVIRFILAEHSITESQMTLFNNFPNFLQYIIIKNAVLPDKTSMIQRCFNMLQADVQTRKANFPGYSEPNDIAIVLNCLGMVDEFKNPRSSLPSEIFTQYGALMIADGLLTAASSRCIENHEFRYCVGKYLYIGIKSGFIDLESVDLSRIRPLLCGNGLKALKLGLMSVTQASKIYHSASSNGPFDNLASLLTDTSFIALSRQYITPEQAAYYPSTHAAHSLIPEGVIALFEKGLINFKEYPGAKIREVHHVIWYLYKLAAPSNSILLESNLITQKHLVACKNLAPLFCANGVKLLQTGWMIADQAIKINDLESLTSSPGMAAVKAGVITVQDAMKYKSLVILTLYNGIKAVSKGLVTLSQADILVSAGVQLESILLDNALQAISEGLVNPEHALNYPRSFFQFSYLFTPVGLQALRLRLVDPATAHDLCLFAMLSDENDPAILTALQYKLITVEDFKAKGKMAIGVKKVNEHVVALVKQFKSREYSEAEGRASIVIQSFFKSFRAKRNLSLLQSVKKQMKEGRLEQLDMLLNARNLLWNNKLDEAERLLQQLPGSPENSFLKNIMPYLIAQPALFQSAIQALGDKRYEFALWQICHIELEYSLPIIKIFVNFQNNFGMSFNRRFGDKSRTLLHILALNKNQEAYELLSAHGARDDLKDENGKTPKDYHSYSEQDENPNVNIASKIV